MTVSAGDLGECDNSLWIIDAARVGTCHCSRAWRRYKLAGGPANLESEGKKNPLRGAHRGFFVRKETP
jgi:hypothetical protein